MAKTGSAQSKVKDKKKKGKKKNDVFKVGKINKTKLAGKPVKSNLKKNIHVTRREVEKVNKAYDVIKDNMMESKQKSKPIVVKNKRKEPRHSHSEMDMDKTVDMIKRL